MAFLGIKVPREVADLLGQVVVPGSREPKDKYHITIINFGKEVPIEELSKATIATFPVCARTLPFQVSTRLVTSFPPGNDGVPIIAAVDSSLLHEFHTQIRMTLDSEGVEYSKKFPEFKPHVTLAYSDKGTDMPDQPISDVTWTVSEMCLFGGDDGLDRRIVTHFPLEMALPDFGTRQASRKTPSWLPAVKVAARFQVACEGGVCTCAGACSCGKRQEPPQGV